MLKEGALHSLPQCTGSGLLFPPLGHPEACEVGGGQLNAWGLGVDPFSEPTSQTSVSLSRGPAALPGGLFQSQAFPLVWRLSLRHSQLKEFSRRCFASLLPDLTSSPQLATSAAAQTLIAAEGPHISTSPNLFTQGSKLSHQAAVMTLMLQC